MAGQDRAQLDPALWAAQISMAIHSATPGSVAARAFLNVAVGTPLNDIFELHGKDLVHVP